MLGRKAQVWSLDLIVAIIIFFAGIIILYVYAVNYNSQGENQLDEMFYDGNLASKLLLSEEDYGLLSDGKINQTKLDAFNASSDQDKKNSLGVKYNFYFTFPGMKINSIPTAYSGIINTTEVSNSVQVTRITIYENTPTKFQLYIWKT